MSPVIRIDSFPEENGRQIAGVITAYTGMYSVDELLAKLPVEIEVEPESFEALRGQLDQLGCNQKFVSLDSNAQELLSPEDRAIWAFHRGDNNTRSFRLYRQNFWLFLGLGSIFWIPIMAASFLPSFETPAEQLTYALLIYLLMHVAYSNILWASSERLLGREVRFVENVSRVNVLEFFRFTWAKTLMYLVTFVGYLLLVIPGIIWSIRLAVSGPVAVIEGKTGPAALRRSSQLAKGRGGVIFGTLFVLGLLVGLASSVISIGLVILVQLTDTDQAIALRFSNLIAYTITTPLVAITMATLYYNLRALSLKEEVLKQARQGPMG